MEVVENPFKNDEENGNFSSKRVCSFTGSGDNRHRIIRVSRASGGKDRHSKVLTSKGLRDRRVRLSVSTAIQFYDLQDRLGFEQPSKAVEWLIEAASEAIAGLPSLNNSFPVNPIQISDDLKMGSDGIDQRRNLSLVERSNCSSNSETSKGSLGFSLSRSEILVNRAKARDRARERTAKEKEREQESCNVLTISDNPSFTELLSVGINNGGVNNNAMAMDYLASSGHNQALPMSSSSTLPFNSNQDRFQHFSLVPENMNDYNLNFTISGNFNRGTLQSNISPSSLLPYLQRFPHLDGSNVPFFIGAAPPTAPLQSENHHHHHQLTPALFDGGWQLCYAADGSHHSDQKGKGKN